MNLGDEGAFFSKQMSISGLYLWPGGDGISLGDMVAGLGSAGDSWTRWAVKAFPISAIP